MDMFSTAYLLSALIAAAMFLAVSHVVLLLIRTANLFHGILITCIGLGGLTYVKQSTLTGETREEAVQILIFILFIGVGALPCAYFNKAIPENERTLKSVVTRFISRHKPL